jgi:hypothetical protein
MNADAWASPQKKSEISMELDHQGQGEGSSQRRQKSPTENSGILCRISDGVELPVPETSVKFDDFVLVSAVALNAQQTARRFPDT